ncbi:MAG: DUF1499 domain-containing protein [Nitrospirales bacterium]
MGHRGGESGRRTDRSHGYHALVRLQGRYRRSHPSSARRSRIDVRSVSRVGKSDVGTNAQRIRAYVRKLSGTGSTS